MAGCEAAATKALLASANGFDEFECAFSYNGWLQGSALMTSMAGFGQRL